MPPASLVPCLGPLPRGARVALISASGPPLARQVQRGSDLLRSWGLEPVPYASVRTPHAYAHWLGGPDELRAADLQSAWCDPSIDAIFCVRGGYGSVRVLDLLDAEAMRSASPKPLFGSSDVTAVHEWLAEVLGVCSWHTPMIGTGDLLDDEVATANLYAAVTQPWRGRVYGGDAAETLLPGSARGRLIGGNLSLLAMTLGARRRPAWDHTGTIALLEDVAEDTYKFDGYLTMLLRAGWFDGVVGVACGSWRGCELAEVRALIEADLGPLGVPIVWELGFGHGPGAASIPLGVEATLDAGASPTLRVGPPE